jgi:hypothetical protein
MSRPDPIQYAERLYAAIRDANFSPISFLAFGNAVKDGVELRRIPRMAAEPFMRVVGEMLDLEEEAAAEDVIDAVLSDNRGSPPSSVAPAIAGPGAPVEARSTLNQSDSSDSTSPDVTGQRGTDGQP